MTIKVLVNGANGKMGRVVVSEIVHESDLQLVAATNKGDDLAAVIRKNHVDVVVDFTTPHDIFETAKTIIANNARPVIGTTGLTQEQIEELQAECRSKSLGGIIAPNFSLGAVLMMQYAKDAMQHFTDAEIIEMHHSQKVDAPSGTAIKTALMMAEKKATTQAQKKDAPRARGDLQHEIPIHSIRLPGLVAHQTIIFGGYEETLTIRHDSLSRKAFMPGVFMACRKVMALYELIYGLENLLL